MPINVVGILAVVFGCAIVFVVVIPLVLWRWLMPRAVAYVKAQFPNSWHLPSTSRWLWFAAMLAFVGGGFVLPGAISDLADKARLKPDSWATFGICMLMLAIFEGGLWTAAFALRLKRGLVAERSHAFFPRWAQVYSTVALVASAAPGMPQPVRQWTERWVVPVDRSWRCEVCGGIRGSQKHANGWRVYDPNDAESAIHPEDKR
jgi:hypothetical protein